MSVNNGNNADENTFNSSFVSRTEDSSTIALFSLKKGSDISKHVDDPQTAIKDNESNIAINSSSISALSSRTDALEIALPTVNFAATVNPTGNNDDSEGYKIGSEWINTSTGAIFKAVDVTTGQAVWKRLDKIMLKVVKSIVFDFSLTNVSDASYVEIDSDVGGVDIKRIQSFYPDGDPMYVATGAIGSEVDNYVMTAGGNAEPGIDVNISANSRLSVKLVSGGITNDTGKLVLNLLGEA